MTGAARLPIAARVEGRACVVVGGGPVAARKVAALITARAAVTVISPAVVPTLHDQALAGELVWVPEPFAPGMLRDLQPMLVFAATNDPAVNQRVASEAHDLRAWVNVVDGSDAGDFDNMSVTSVPPIQIAITTGGTAPALTAHLKEVVRAVIGEEYAILAQWMTAHRRTAGPDRAAYQALLASDVLALLRAGQVEQARALFDALVTERVS